MGVFTVYKVTNLLNSRYYFGVHETGKPDDDYLGSGIAVKRAIKKYGKHNFRKDVLFLFPSPVESYAKEVELLQAARQDPLCYNLHEGGKGGFRYINENGLSDPGRAGHIAKEKGKTGRPRGSGNVFTAISSDPRLLCMYGCGRVAAFLVSRRENPCCSPYHGACPAYQCRKRKMKSVPIEARLGAFCFYQCGQPAKFLLGKLQKPCCSGTFYECPGHWRNRVNSFSIPKIRQKIETTLLTRYGVINPTLNPDLLAKRDLTNLKRYGGLSPTCRPDIERKRNKTNKERYGGLSPACNSKIAEKIKAAWAKKTLSSPK